MLDAVIDEIDGRDVRIGDRWLTDYASTSYLGLDVDEEIIDALPEYLARWGIHPSAGRLLGAPVLVEEAEERLTSLLGAEDALVLAASAHIHVLAIEALAGGGTVFLEPGADRGLTDGVAVAVARGASIVHLRAQDPVELEALLESDWRRPGVVCLSGVDAMTGALADLPQIAAVARRHGVLVYVEDSHGFGVLGEPSPFRACPYGLRGNGIVRHAGETYDNLVLVGSLSHAYASQAAFIACPTPVKQLLKTVARLHLDCGPPPVASLASVLEGLRVNEVRGEALRGALARLTRRLLDTISELGIAGAARHSFPIVHLPVGDPAAVGAVAEMLFERGILATPAVSPLVAPQDAGIRLAVTAGHTPEQVDHLSSVLRELARHFKLRETPAD